MLDIIVIHLLVKLFVEFNNHVLDIIFNLLKLILITPIARLQKRKKKKKKK